MPNSLFPFLGVHCTKMMIDGAMHLGPNAVLVFARQGNSKTTNDQRNHGEMPAFPALRKLAARYCCEGFQDIVCSLHLLVSQPVTTWTLIRIHGSAQNPSRPTVTVCPTTLKDQTPRLLSWKNSR